MLFWSRTSSHLASMHSHPYAMHGFAVPALHGNCLGIHPWGWQGDAAAFQLTGLCHCKWHNPFSSKILPATKTLPGFCWWNTRSIFTINKKIFFKEVESIFFFLYWSWGNDLKAMVALWLCYVVPVLCNTIFQESIQPEGIISNWAEPWTDSDLSQSWANQIK